LAVSAACFIASHYKFICVRVRKVDAGNLNLFARSREPLAHQFRPISRDGTINRQKILCVPDSDGDSGEAERSFQKEAERHSGMIPNTIGA
jgi:hypothetical protein